MQLGDVGAEQLPVPDDGRTVDEDVAGRAVRPQDEPGERVQDVGQVVAGPDDDVGAVARLQPADVVAAEAAGAALGRERQRVGGQERRRDMSRWRARYSARRSSGKSAPTSLDATPSTPSPTGAPAATRSADARDPRARAGSCSTGSGRCRSASRRAGRPRASSKWMPCATQTSGATQPMSSSTCERPRAEALQAVVSSSRVSARWVCSRSPSRRASAADSVISLGVTLNGLQGATVTTTRSPSCSRACTASVDARIASRSSTTESGGRPPWLCPRSIEPRAIWARIPMRARAAAMASNTESSPPGTR